MVKYAIIVAGGNGARMGSTVPKQFMILNSMPLLMYPIKAFADAGINNIIVVIPKAFRQYWLQLCSEYNCNIPHTLIDGGIFRTESVKNGLSVITDPEALVAVHDGVRPFIDSTFINQAFQIAFESGSAVPYLDIRDSIRVINNMENKSVERDKYKTVQTPQCFKLSVLRAAYENSSLPSFSDDASLVEMLNLPITLFKGTERNIKITTPLDLKMAEAILSENKEEVY